MLFCISSGKHVKRDNNPLFGCFSISSEIPVHFGLTLFTVLAILFDNERNEVPKSFLNAFFLIAGSWECRQSDKP